MKKLFVHHPLFRLLSPLFSGTLVYLLILLINNNIVQLQETFLGQELYTCIGLAYIIQEFSRFSLLFFEHLKEPKSFILKIVIQLIVSLIMTMILVSSTMYLYFKYILLYEVNIRELYVFNVIFIFITLVYVMLYISHHFLYKINTTKISKEVDAKNAIEEDFLQFRKGINPKLLYESMETMLVLMKDNPDEAEQFLDYFSSVYRYILTKQHRELVPISEELDILNSLVQLFNQLPYRNVIFTSKLYSKHWVLPTTLLTLLERIIRTTIVSEKHSLKILLEEIDDYLKITYSPEEKLNRHLSMGSLKDIVLTYTYYTDQKITITTKGNLKIVDLPKLHYHENSNH
ncbi:histidine kinase [Croceitalea rosinachiae]|uniref:Histidine kinase n=1 Tax=Croceitalea rosinachiae TaxID=3075596 RepID=A0ABU3ABM3_9FLAO|nr:histidine kinase [Croceitalea sp. F388]MDT0607581.1 histidine kinase [Croceitalea sp. F388]